MDQGLHTELWTSWASLLRSYAAAHGLSATQHAVVEVSADQITLRVGSRWLKFTEHEMQHGSTQEIGEASQPFALNENGTVTIHGETEEMDLAAERLAREMLHPPQ
jgi:Cft2 family RNA processing exonuclease